MTVALGDEKTLRAEAIVFSSYLIGRQPAPETVGRYVAAHRELLVDPAGRRDQALLATCRRHPRALPFLDAAAGLFARDSLLRKKLLVMAAVLETTPSLAQEFLPRAVSTPSLTLRLLGNAATATFRILVGAVLFLVVGGWRR